MTVILGITGTIGSGKSTVGKLLTEAGVPVFDTDHMVHAMLTDDNPVRQAVIARFGDHIRREDGPIDRPKLAAIVFSDAAARKDLEAIVHPEVRRRIRLLAEEHADRPVVAFLVPLLFEAGSQAQYDQVWTVTADDSVLRERLKSRDQMDDAQIDRRLSAQMPQAEKAARANRVIDNSKSLEHTRDQLLAALSEIQTAQK